MKSMIYNVDYLGQNIVVDTAKSEIDFDGKTFPYIGWVLNYVDDGIRVGKFPEYVEKKVA